MKAVKADAQRQAEIREEIAAEQEEILAAATTWKPWLGAVLPEYFGGGFAKRHQRFWEWVWSVGPEDAPRRRTWRWGWATMGTPTC